QRMRKLEQLPACHHHHPRTTVGSLQNVDRDTDRTSALLANIIGEHQIRSIDPVVTSQLCHSHHLITTNFQILDLQWQGAFHLEQDPLDTRYLIYLVLAGSLVHTIATVPSPSQPEPCLNGQQDPATIVNPGQKLSSLASSAGKALVIAIERDSIESTLSSLLNRPLRQPAIFAPSIDLTSELGQSLKKLLQFLWESTQGEGAATASLVMQKLEQAFLDCAVEGLPNNYTEELLYQTDGALACHVRKARAFIESHLHEDIKLGDIAAATQVCSRLLQKAFSHHCGCSPMRFLTQSRLQRIRQELEAAPSDIKIVDVMMQYGFTQGGKFAKEYQQLFGEKPSETLKRRRQSNNPDGESPLWQKIDEPRSARVIGGVNPPLTDRPFGSSLWWGWRRFFNARTYLAR
ncbi:AraC family transcriptional regulator, partial [Chamaesiphon sp. VAR_69_metabat_338]|uniref:AraC family transcriptional regulator n=1 Tax=Chamaesiphon sp. VAR_69_metabat_338 TaxID=2964704 RepID=UPI00286E5563